MARIKRTDIYPYDITPSKPDFLVGSDFDDGSKTKSYSLDTIFGLFKDSGFIQDASKDGVPYVRQDGSWVPAPTSGAGGDVVSVFGRIGAVSAVEGDYAAFYADIDHTHSWGEMQGTLSDQTDLQNALNLKYDASNPSGYISSVDWGDIGGTLSNQADLQNALNLKYDASNPSGYISSVDWGDIGGTLSLQTDLQNALNLKLESVDWGDIGGTLSNQTDLQNALNLKLESVDWGDIGGTLSAQTDLQNALNLKLESVDISDINALGTPTINTFLRGDGNWATYVTSLGTLSDVTLTAPSTGDVLRLSGSTWVNDDLSDVEFVANKGAANGYAPLDSGVKIPISYIPDSLIGQVNYQGTWAASSNTPTLANPPSAATKGHYYVCSDSGTQFGISFQTGDWIISNGTAWEKVDNTDAVTSVFGRIGAVVANSGDYTFAQIGSKPTTISGYGITDAYTESEVDTLLLGKLGISAKAADSELLDGIDGSNYARTDIDEIFNGQVQVNNIRFIPNSSFANANDFTSFMVGDRSLITVSHGANSTNYPTEFGHALIVRGSSDNRSFSLWKANGDNAIFYLGNYNSALNTWQWNTVWHAGNDGAGSGLDADLLRGAHWGSVNVPIEGTLSADTGGITTANSFKIGKTTSGTYFNLVDSVGGSTSMILRSYASSGVQMVLNNGGITANGNILAPVIIGNSSSTPVRLVGTGTGQANQVMLPFLESNGSTQQGYVGFPSNSNSNLHLLNNISGTNLRLDESGGINGLSYYDGTGYRTVWHHGNDGAGSGLDADLLDGVQGSGYVQTSRTFTAGDGLTGGGNLTANRTFAVDSTVVRTSGTQSIGGAKTFTSNVIGSGTFTGTNFILSSDRRLKKDIRDYSPTPLPIKWRTFDWKSGAKNQIGVIAQEVQEVAPHLVEKAKDGTLSVRMIDLLVARVAELEARIINLER